MKILRLLGCLLAAALTAVGQTNIVGSGFVMGSTSGSSGGSGTVTSVGLTIGGFTVTGSPVTTSGTLAATLSSPVANGIVVSDSSGNLSASTATMVSGNTLKFAGTSMIADDTTGALLLTPGTGKKTLLQGSNAGTNAETVNNSASGNSGLDFYNSSGVFQGTIGYGNASSASHAGQFFINVITGSAIHFSVNTSDVSVLSVAAASTPIALYNGTWFVSGGTGSTTWPALLVQPAGTTTTTWNTNGTAIGVNAASGFAGNLTDLQNNGASKFLVDSAGDVVAVGNLKIANGSGTNPSYNFTSGNTTGLSFANPGIGFSVAATSVGSWTATQLNVLNGSGGGTLSLGGATVSNTNAGSIAISASGNGQAVNLIGNQAGSSNTGAATSLSNSAGFAGANVAQIGAQITYTINQTGTSSFTDLLVNRTQTAAGSGSQLLLDLRVGNVTKFNVDNTGALTLVGLLTGANIVASGSMKSSGATSGIGYQTGAGGTVTQLTSRTTGVTLNTVTGAITGINTSLAATTAVTFTVTDSAVAATDKILVHLASGGAVTTSYYCSAVAAGSFNITLYNENTVTADTTTPVMGFEVLKGTSN